MIPYGRQDISEEDIQAVVDVLRSDFLTQGPAVPQFEQAVCDYTGAEYGIAVNSATSALHIACESLGLGKGDWLWTTPITFVASANCGLYCGARVDFVDIDPISWNLSPKALKDKLEKSKKNNCLPKVLVVVHLCGLPCDMESIYALSKEYGFYIIEDASHAIGGKYKNEPIGNCRYSDITVFSFHPVKTMTTGEGGMVVTNKKNLFDSVRLLRSHGVTRNVAEMEKEPDGAWYYEQITLGYNYRMTDVQAALGYSQLRRLDSFVEKRHQLAARYDHALSGLPLMFQSHSNEQYSGLHLYIVRLEQDEMKRNHAEVFDFLRDGGVGVNLHYIPIYRQPYYQRKGFFVGDYPESERYYNTAISLPMYPSLTKKQQEYVIKILNEAIGGGHNG